MVRPKLLKTGIVLDRTMPVLDLGFYRGAAQLTWTRLTCGREGQTAALRSASNRAAR